MRRLLFAIMAFTLAGCLAYGQSLRLYTEIGPPNQLLDANGRLTGFAVELVRELQKRTGNRDPIELVPWVRAYKALETEPNVLLFSVARIAKRDPLFHWVGPIGESSFAFYVKADSGHAIHSLDDARKLRLIGVYKEDVRDQYLSRLGFTNLDRSIDERIIVRKLMDGRIDALVGAQESMEEVTRMAGVRFGDLRETFVFQRVQTYLAFSKGTPAPLVKSWSEALLDMRKEKSFDALYRKYFPTGPMPGPEAKPF